MSEESSLEKQLPHHMHNTAQNGNKPKLSVDVQDKPLCEQKVRQQPLEPTELLKIPMVLVILQLLSSLLSSLGYVPDGVRESHKRLVDGKDKERQVNEYSIRGTIKEEVEEVGVDGKNQLVSHSNP